MKARFVEKSLPLGAPKAAPDYQIPDPYIRFWFNVIFAYRGAETSHRVKITW
jgi:hypothetical protein